MQQADYYIDVVIDVSFWIQNIIKYQKQRNVCFEKLQKKIDFGIGNSILGKKE